MIGRVRPSTGTWNSSAGNKGRDEVTAGGISLLPRTNHDPGLPAALQEFQKENKEKIGKILGEKISLALLFPWQKKKSQQVHVDIED